MSSPLIGWVMLAFQGIPLGLETISASEAVRGSTSIRTSSGALIVSGTSQITGSTSTVFVFPQDLVKVLFSGAAFSGPFAGLSVYSIRKRVVIGAFGVESL